MFAHIEPRIELFSQIDSTEGLVFVNAARFQVMLCINGDETIAIKN